MEDVCSRVREQLPGEDAIQAEAFVRQYYRWVSTEDIAERNPLDMYGLALAHFNYARVRPSGVTKVRVFNPRFETHGWQSTHTAVEIVTDDKPFLIDSEVDRQTDPAALEKLREHLLRVIAEVRAAVEDWPAMRKQALDLAAELAESPPPLEPEEIAEARAFMEWLEDHHFTFLGYREYELVTEEGELRLSAVVDSGLGILRESAATPGSRGFEKLPPRVRALALEPYLLNLTKANSRATVHRPSYLDYVGVKRFDAEGRVVGERRFLGLYAHTTYAASPTEIPILRRKVEAVLQRAGFPPASHNEKALIEILESHPRDELFQTPVDELFEIAMGILNLGERQRLRLFMRRDPFGRFLSCLVFVPRDRFNTENRRRIEAILRQATRASSIDYTTRVSESVLVRLHYIAYTDPARLPGIDAREIELMLVAATRSWADDLAEALIDEQGEERGNELRRRYGEAFPAAYRADWVARSAIADIKHIEELPERDGLQISLYRPLESPPGVLRAKLFRSGRALALSDVLPLFEHMGVDVADERPYAVTPRDAESVWIYDFGLIYRGESELVTDEIKEAFESAFLRTWRGEVENDNFNRLVLAAGLTWRQIVILRAVGRYLRQAGTTFSDRYVEHAVVLHPEVASLLVELFRARFEPGLADRSAADRLVERIGRAIDAVESLDQDQILRMFLGLIEAMLRTNFFQRGPDGEPKPHISFKLDPARVPRLPQPRPRFEIFVYSPRTEGSHLRGGRVARGGIRWSDRREDFRTEVLGLM